MKLRIGLSPCPNDTFMLDALINGRIDLEGIQWEIVMEDVEQLNQRALRRELDVTKLSFHAGLLLMNSYAVLNSGAALGRGCGPLLIAKKELTRAKINEGRIAIPGKLTTANLLFKLCYPNATPGQEVFFSKIEQAILDEEVVGGVIIHENRFTYQQKGLIKIIDLGAYWEEKTGMPIPLGAFFVNRSLSAETRQRVERSLRSSIAFAFQNPKASAAFVREHAQEMDQSVIDQHIALYVNDFSLNLGEDGNEAIQRLFAEARSAGLLVQ